MSEKDLDIPTFTDWYKSRWKIKTSLGFFEISKEDLFKIYFWNDTDLILENSDDFNSSVRSWVKWRDINEYYFIKKFTTNWLTVNTIIINFISDNIEKFKSWEYVAWFEFSNDWNQRLLRIIFAERLNFKNSCKRIIN